MYLYCLLCSVTISTLYVPVLSIVFSDNIQPCMYLYCLLCLVTISALYVHVLSIVFSDNISLVCTCTVYCVYRTRSNYPNILIARTACSLILFPSHFVEYAEFLVSYPFYLTEWPHPATRCNGKFTELWQKLESAT